METEINASEVHKEDQQMKRREEATRILQESKEGFGAVEDNDLKDNDLKVPDSASQAFEVILTKVGDYHKYQWKLVIICGFCGLFTSLHNVGGVFLAATPDHWCAVPYFKNNNITLGKSSLNYTAPMVRSKEGTIKASRCSYYDFDYADLASNAYLPVDATAEDYATTFIEFQNTTDALSCESYIYDKTYHSSTIATEWNLVCGDRWKMSSVQASYMMGILAGAVIFSAVSDKIGRRKSSLICTVLFIMSSVCVAFANSFELVLVLRFLTAGAGQGMFLVNYILVMETVSLKGRNVMGNFFHMGFSIGFVFLCLFGYLVRDWRNLQLVCSVPTCILLAYFWVLPESARWLVMHGHNKEGVRLLREIARTNGTDVSFEKEIKPLLNIIEKEVENIPHVTVLQKIHSVWDGMVTLVRTPNMRKRSLIIFYCWFVTSMVSYGMLFNGANFNASIYLTMTIYAVTSLLGIPFTIGILFKIGRRPTLSWHFLGGGIACLTIIFIDASMIGWNLFLSTLGQFLIGNSFSLVFMYSAELVPTHVRNISIGMGSMWARIGSAIAPYIVDLLGDIYFAIPSGIFGVMSLIAGVLCLLLPETGYNRLPESIEEIEAMNR